MRASMNLHDLRAVLLCNNCTAHINEDIKVLLTRDNIRLVIFPPHPPHLFESLDLVTFGVFRREHHDLRARSPKDSQAWQITKLMMALECATDSCTNRPPFKKQGW
jgi:hypothetical protein